ncbi:methionyl-tRNA formyltransferase [Desulfobacterales bacterium HSG16]|nr:methionyl-tRNA formyltransferase [Desulfobacterales bacterium HSG16]
MKEKKLKIVFMGTPDFAVPALDMLKRSHHEVTLVVTMPDRPKGRGKKLLPPPVKAYAQKAGYKIVQPESIKTDEFYNLLKKTAPDLFVVVAFGHILPESLLSIPELGPPINIHASLLPKYRGPAPIQRSIIDGESETGITIMYINEKMDQGDILLQEKIRIMPDDTSETLHDKLAAMGADLLEKTLKLSVDNRLNPVVQDHSQTSYAAALTKKDGHIDWNMAAEKIESLIRGVTPWPGAFTFLNDRRLKIFKAEVIKMEVNEKPGEAVKGFADELRIATGNKGCISIIEIQGASGKRLNIADFLRGCPVTPGTLLS